MNSIDKVSFNANGKILLTGEYLVINGATALAFPLSRGQSLTAQSFDGNNLIWTAADSDGIWFTGNFSVPTFELLNSSDDNIAAKLSNILKKASDLNPRHSVKSGFKIDTYLNFKRQWGFGSSSTLIAIVAQLFEIDKYKLFNCVSSGSGYDVACTEFNNPILYTRSSKEEAIIRPVNFNPSFSLNLWFVYLGNKQSTDTEVNRYKKIIKKDLSASVQLITDITLRVTQVNDLTTFVRLLEEHEYIMSEILERQTIKESRFADFNGCIKSLGAWGGDFVLACSEKDESYILKYFRSKGVNTLYKFDSLVLSNKIINQHDIIIRF